MPIGKQNSISRMQRPPYEFTLQVSIYFSRVYSLVFPARRTNGRHLADFRCQNQAMSSIGITDNADGVHGCALQVRPNPRTRFQLTLHQELHAKWGPHLPPGSIAVQVCPAPCEAMPIWIPGSGINLRMTPAHTKCYKVKN